MQKITISLVSIVLVSLMTAGAVSAQTLGSERDVTFANGQTDKSSCRAR